MPKAIKKGASRQRKERFNEDELEMLAGTLQEHADMVFCQSMKREAIIRKKEIWALVEQKVSAVGNTPGTIKDCRKRWDDLRLRVRNILSANRSQAMATGGGASSPIKLSRWEDICASLIGIEGIEGVGDMECGATTTADGGSDLDSDAHDSTPQKTTPRKRAQDEANRPSISKGQPKARRAPPEKTPQAPVLPRAVEAEAPTPVVQPQETAEAPHSAESSLAGEVAATAPQAEEAQEEVWMPVEDSPQNCSARPVHCHPPKSHHLSRTTAPPRSSLGGC
ncbi:myb-related transcription factor, partner of profilin-like [Ambystoma mexicanum]|uniref:myb-related transcription factor, partner of profilin-like n=1 Tax=Ambystoma mexicanum TaxID=8296 RepID=UPI0037E75F91